MPKFKRQIQFSFIFSFFSSPQKMRTRFLNNDYFTLPPSQPPFLHLPVPRLPTPPSTAANHHHHQQLFSPLPNLSLHLDPFPIETALSSFLSAVLPHRISVEENNDLTVLNPDRDSSVSEIRNREVRYRFQFTFCERVNVLRCSCRF